MNKYNIGDTVYLRTDPEQLEYIICGYSVSGENLNVQYCLRSGTEETWHYGIEISKQRDELKRVS